MNPPKLSRPTLLNTVKEVSAPLDWLNTLTQLPRLLKLPKGDNRPILLIPGYLADEFSMWPLQRFLNKMQYSAQHWDLGRNLGDVDVDIERLIDKTKQCYVQHNNQPVTLIGWSLGGVLAREAARLSATQVKEVITLGTPITGGPKYTAVGNAYARRKKLNLDTFEQHVLERNSIGFDQPVTSIYSKTDGIVGWQASLDVYNNHARNIEVNGTHIGLGINPKVWEIIIQTLSNS